MNRIISIAFLMAISAGLHSAKIIDGWLWEIPKTEVVPVIDGKQDAVWKTLDWNFVDNCYSNRNTPHDKWTDMFGACKLTWDENNMYGIFYAQDDFICDMSTNPWEKDGFYICFDGDNKAEWDDPNMACLALDHLFIKNPLEYLAYYNPRLSTEGAEAAVFDDTTSMNGYWIEFKFPLINLFITPVAGTLIGLDIRHDDNDNDIFREQASYWWLDCEGDWELWILGTAILSDRLVGEKLEIKRTPIAPVFDGLMDAVYSGANPVTMNSFGNGGSYPVDFHDNFARWYLLYDDQNFYGFCDVYDDSIVDNTTNSWERDDVEIFLDGDNSKGKLYDGINDTQLNFSHKKQPNGGIIIWPIFPQPGEYLVVDDSLGYDIEFRVPLADIRMVPEAGKAIGFELHQTVADSFALPSISKWWHEHGDSSWRSPATFGTAYLGSLIQTEVEKKEIPVAKRFKIAQNYPNPFNSSTEITYSVSVESQVSIKIYNTLGQLVMTLVDQRQQAGEYTSFWDGRDSHGNAISSGVYICRIEADEYVRSLTMVLLK